MNAKRDSKDPAPTADHSQRVGGGNEPYVGGEDHGAKKAEYVREGARFSLRKGGETQPGRQNGDGNCPVTGETHNSKKAESIPASRRF